RAPARRRVLDDQGAGGRRGAAEPHRSPGPSRALHLDADRGPDPGRVGGGARDDGGAGRRARPPGARAAGRLSASGPSVRRARRGARLASILKIRPGEGTVAARVLAMMFVVWSGFAIGGNAVEGLLFARFGPDALPYLFVALGVATSGVMLGMNAVL